MPGIVPGSSTSATVDLGDAIDGEALDTGGSEIIGWASQLHNLLNTLAVYLEAAIVTNSGGIVNNPLGLQPSSDGVQALVALTAFSDLLAERVANTDGASTASTAFGATAAKKNYITAISIKNTSSTDGFVDFRDGAAGSVLFTVNAPATGGATISNGGMPLFATTAATALAYDVSGALTTVYISVTGFKAA